MNLLQLFLLLFRIPRAIFSPVAFLAVVFFTGLLESLFLGQMSSDFISKLFKLSKQ